MIRAAALFLAIFIGFTGLVYQVTWQKYLATLLGSHSEATVAVLVPPRGPGQEKEQGSAGVVEAVGCLHKIRFPRCVLQRTCPRTP